MDLQQMLMIGNIVDRRRPIFYASFKILVVHLQQMLAIDNIVGWWWIFKLIQKINLLGILVADLRQMSTTGDIVHRLWPLIELCSKSW